MFLASIIGSANAQVAVMGQVMVPEMEKQGYQRGFATATARAAALYVAARVTGAKPSEILPPLMPFLLATMLIMVRLSWQPYLVTALIN